jgi:K+-sensing histidine kinase KdpD
MDAGASNAPSFLEPTVETPGDRQQLAASFRLILRLRFIVFPAVLALVLLASLAGPTRRSLLDGPTLLLHGINAAVVLSLNALALFLVRRVRNIAPLVLFQLAIDALNFTFTIYKTGGAASPLVFLYYGPIFAASILAGARATFATAGLSAVLYTAIVLLEAFAVLPHQPWFPAFEGVRTSLSYLALALLFTLFSLALIAFLASYLARELRRRQHELRAANTELERRLRTMHLLHRTTGALNRSASVREVADAILGDLVSFLDLDRALLYLASGKTLHLFMVKHRAGERRPAGAKLSVRIPLRRDAGLTARAALERRSYNVRRPEESPLINRELAGRIGMNPFALLPLVVRDRLVGVLGVDRSATFGEIGDEEFRLLEVFANQAAIAIAGLARPRSR